MASEHAFGELPDLMGRPPTPSERQASFDLTNGTIGGRSHSR